ncbi:MAG: Asp-tRNA(Asn)/Glu-tRNA(Gln) amidotransferase subunit GatA [Nanoarchaeota archaeon]|nr:Asp-tRNA(Asn)/Glu-tRNA(Gln) amidotransferase subunit GatA [Nanoarchaeota archaeon]MBU4299784.1 Asp-tRNA(Asn)/Glu-tRNA(Gln) amidotransferase subunit GatA [Nanoarchaeota archaeon]MBU4452094.1 Asp-tRNA(Asn)/Glu-tRNA(Gln) amidotransferase subunit GatA [Nanoarchaeota archaeon]MCG2723168.1 Asp-tRNA(Asn)/Glu-tRNA(Gln) amidotransferase subunit GatA [archaeon]
MSKKYSGMSVSDFISESKKGNIDTLNFYGAFFSEIEKLQKKYNYFVTISQDSAMEQLKKLPKGALTNIPISVKDNICTKGIRTTAGSKILESYVPPFDATCIERAKKEGGVIIGKTVQDEFGFGTFSVNSAYGIPKNPIDIQRSCGGSSGGAGGITAALEFPHIAIAESTGGSISAPAAFCGVYGLTPTYGRVSRYGLIDYASSLDKIGVMAKKVDDIALGLSVIAGHDAKDSTSLAEKVDDFQMKSEKLGASETKRDDYSLKTDLRKIIIGVPREFFGSEINEDIKKVVWTQIKTLESEGAKVEECSLPNTEFSIPAYYIIAMAEASTNLAKFCGIRYGATLPLEGEFNEYFSKVRGKYLGEEAKRRIILGTYARMAGYRDKYYLKAMKVRQLIINDYKQAFKKYDILVSPTMPFIAPKFSEIEKLTPIEHYYADILTGSPNLAGIPMLSAPCGTSKGMPVGIHILGNYLAEKTILNVGRHI